MASYRLYIDDSGTKEYAAEGEAYGRAGGKSRYFVFGGVLLTDNEAGNLAGRIADYKRLFFGTDRVEIKSNWLRMPKEKERRYLQPYGLSEKALSEFVQQYYETIAEADLQLIAAVVDKQHMQERYPSPWYAPTVAYEFLLQRAVQEVRRPDTVSVYVDDMMGATPAGNQYKDNLRRHHASLVQRGSSLLKGVSFASLNTDLKFLDSAHSHQIQVADIAAYNVYRQFLEHGEAWEEQAENLPAYEWFLKLSGKFRQGPDNRIQGYGVVKAPLLQRVRWRYDPE